MTAAWSTVLANRLGADRVLVGGACARYRLGNLVPAMVASPTDEAEVAAVLATAARDGLGVVPWGGGTHQSFGRPPARYDLALDLGRLNRVLFYEPADPPVPPRAEWQPLPEVTWAAGPVRGRAGLLTGCAQRYLLPGVNRASARVLAAAGYDVVAPREQGCCGALHLHAGEVGEARALAKALIATFEGAGVDLVVSNAAGCGAAMREYGHLLQDEPGWRERAATFSAKVRDISEVVAGHAWNGSLRAVPVSVTYHEACHLAHAQGIRLEPRALLRGIPALRLVELPESDVCCGSAGVYNLLQPSFAQRILRRKIENIRRTGADFVAAGNIGCLLQLRLGLREAGLAVRTVHPVELLDWALHGMPADGRGQRAERRERRDGAAGRHTTRMLKTKEQAMGAQVGQQAPDFTLVGTDLRAVSLQDFAGKHVVLAFYPAAFTGVCQKELCTFRDQLNDFAGAHTAVVGVSVDSPFANKEFAAKNGLTFPLLSDITREVIARYDVVFNDLAGIKGFTVAKRAVFVIDRAGVIRYRWVAPEPKLEPDYAEVAAAVKQLA